MIRSSSIMLAMLVSLLPLGAVALLQIPAAETEHRIEVLLRQPPAALTSALPLEPGAATSSAETAESYGQLKEQILGLIPGDALEFVARGLADQQFQVKLSSKKALLVFRLPLE